MVRSTPVRPGTTATLVALVLIPLLASACATGRGARGEDVPAGPTVVEVENGNFADVVVYALGDHRYVRLGNVTGHQRATLELPRYLENTLDLRLVAAPIGSTSSYLSERILFEPGDVLVLNVGATINLSSISVRAGRPAGG